jgi:hypothetical protein
LLIFLWWSINILLLTKFLLRCLKVHGCQNCVIINMTSNKIETTYQKHILHFYTCTHIQSTLHKNHCIASKHCISSSTTTTFSIYVTENIKRKKCIPLWPFCQTCCVRPNGSICSSNGVSGAGRDGGVSGAR